MRHIRLREFTAYVALAKTQDCRAHTRVRTELHDEIECEAVIRSTEERQEQASLLAHAKRRAANEQRDVRTCVREHAAHEVGVQ
jgi:hypothetical protein